MTKVNSFDVLKEMSARNMSIQFGTAQITSPKPEK